MWNYEIWLPTFQVLAFLGVLHLISLALQWTLLKTVGRKW